MKYKVRYCLAALLIASASAKQQERDRPAAGSQLADFDLDALLAVQISSPARKEESLFDTASAAGVLTGTDIRHSGATRLPDALRYATGAQVAQHGSRGWAISIRGFNKDSSNKLEVLMDGRSLYTPFFSGVLWDHTDYVLQDIDRIEVVRGPAPTMWGANAVNGVINIFTKGSESTQGTLLHTTLAYPENLTQSARVGFKLREGLFARVYAKYYSQDNIWFENGQKSHFDATEMLRVGFRSDYLPQQGSRLIVEGEVYTDKLGLRQDEFPTLDGGFLLARWEQEIDSAASYQIQGYYDRYDRLYLGAFEERRDTFDTSVQFRYQGFSGHDLVGGAGYRHSWDESMQVSIPFLEPANEGFGIGRLFLQDEIQWGRKAQLLIGTTLTRNGLVSRWDLQPNARFRWTPSDHAVWWTAISKAARTPARVDTDLRWITPGFQFRANREHRSEKTISYELGHRRRFGASISMDLALFYNDYDDLPSTEPQGEGVYFYENLQAGRTWGGEMSLEFRPTHRSKYTLGYSYLGQSFRLKPGSGANPGSSAAALGNDVENIATLGAVFELPAAVELSAYLRYMDSLPAPAVPSYLMLDMRIAWAPGPGMEFALMGRNLLDHRHPEYRASSPFRREISRSIEAQATFNF